MSLRNKVLASGAIVGSALLAVTLTSSGTLATWSNDINLDSATITSGNLEVAPLGNMAWSDSSDPANPVSIDLNTYKIVPGDTLTSVQDIDMALEGDNMLASFDLDFALASSGSLLAGLTITYDIVDENNVVVVPETSYDTAATQFTVGENDVAPDLDSTKDYTVRIKVVFPDTTENRDYTEVNAILNSAQIHVKQVRSASGNSSGGTGGGTAPSTSVTTLGYRITGGQDSMFSVQSDGSVKAWGRNVYGELGVTTGSPSQSTPLLIPGVSDVVKISAGYYHVLALTSTGEVYSWGNNYYGQLGNGLNQNFAVSPALIPGLINVKDIKAGIRHSMALLNDGTVKTWGRNSVGELGQGNTSNLNVPTLVPGVNFIDSIEVSSRSSFAVDNTGNIHMWGEGAAGVLGNNSTSNLTTPGTLSLTNIKKVECGYSHCFGLTNSYELYGWGWNGQGQLGFSSGGGNSLTPNLVSSIQNIHDVKGLMYATAVTDTTGSTYLWGFNGNGNLGYGDNSHKIVPTINTSIPLGSELYFSRYSYQSIVLRPDNTWVVFGLGSSGALGNGTDINSNTPILSSSAY